MSGHAFALHLFGGFELRDGGALVELSTSSRRMLSLLALHQRPLSRGFVADMMWPDVTEGRAHANLRTTLWRMPGLLTDLCDVNHLEIGLRPDVWVDARELGAAAREQRRTGVLPDPESLLEMRGELLPELWDSWLVFERERLREEAVHLLECSCTARLRRGDLHLARLLSLCAVECDPLRASSNLLVVRVHEASGDTVGAIRCARRYARLLEEELGIRPPVELGPFLRPRAAGEPAMDDAVVSAVG